MPGMPGRVGEKGEKGFMGPRGVPGDAKEGTPGPQGMPGKIMNFNLDSKSPLYIALALFPYLLPLSILLEVV